MSQVVNRLGSEAFALEMRAVTANELWESREVTFSEMNEELASILFQVDRILGETESLLFGETVQLERNELVDALGAMVESADGMIDGLHARDTGQARQAALTGFSDGAARLYALQVRLQAMASRTETTTTTATAPGTTTSTASPVIAAAPSSSGNGGGAGGWVALVMVGTGAFAFGWFVHAVRRTTGGAP